MLVLPAIDMVATGKNIARLGEAAGLTVKDLQNIIGFYEKTGFKVCSEEFLEEGVIHVKVELEV